MADVNKLEPLVVMTTPKEKPPLSPGAEMRKTLSQLATESLK